MSGAFVVMISPIQLQTTGSFTLTNISRGVMIYRAQIFTQYDGKATNGTAFETYHTPSFYLLYKLTGITSVLFLFYSN